MSPSDPPRSRILSTFDRCHRPKYRPRPHADEFTRCDILPDSEPPLCQHCKQYGFECTFFLPIAETRFKKKKLEEEAAEKARSENTDGRNSSTPLGESSRSADARVYGAASSGHHLLPRLTLHFTRTNFRSSSSSFQCHNSFTII